MKYELKHKLEKPRRYYDSVALFEFCVNRIIQLMNHFRYPLNLDGEKAFKTHIEWASLIFGNGNDTNKGYLSKVTGDFQNYLIHNKRDRKYKWNLQKISEEHPGFFKGKKSNDSEERSVGMIKAIEDEIRASDDNTRRNTIKVIRLDSISLSNNEKVYVAELDLEDDEDTKLVEGLPITIKVGIYLYQSTVLDFDKIENLLYFQLNESLSKSYSITVQISASWILKEIKERIKYHHEEKSFKSLITKFLKRQAKPEKLQDFSQELQNVGQAMDSSQLEAFRFAMQHDISIIWGPPGTGKSFTLSHIIKAIFHNNETALITCVANVAVDSITSKFVELLKEQKIHVNEGQVLRLGYTRDNNLLKTEYLFPNNQNIRNLRKRILEIEEELQNKSSNKLNGLELKTELSKLKDSLKKAVDSLLQGSKIVFATASKFFIDPSLSNKEFDNLIIDEASMFSIPHFVALGATIKKRIIIVGDFRQLGPVVLSQTENAKKWLCKDLFEFSGIKTRENLITHPALKQLLVQRRSHEKICNLINKPFYQGKLKSETIFKDDNIVYSEPFAGKRIVYKKLGLGNKADSTQRGSRINYFSAREIMSILDIYHQSDIRNHTIGLVTPYRGQVRHYKELILKRKYDSGFLEKVKVGTIHAFQGSECDVIIFDVVDSMDIEIGKLYRQSSGKRLVNVAISRARHKLIVCGDIDIFINGMGHTNVENDVKTLFLNVAKYLIDEK